MCKICETCGKEHDGSFGSGRFCSRSCANRKSHTEECNKKVSETLKKYFDELEKIDRVCEKCGKVYHSRDGSRKFCFECFPQTIKHAKTKKRVDSILDLSKRTVEKVLKRLCLPCTCCGVYFENVVFDIHHIVPKKLGGTDDMDNLTYICPNCHRIAHSNPSLLKNSFVSLKDYFFDNNIDWKSVYYVKTE